MVFLSYRKSVYDLGIYDLGISKVIYVIFTYL